jgi:hypothetical protein
MTNEQIAEWNAAVASDDQALIKSLQRQILADIHTTIMDDDENYSQAGWKR